MKPNSKGPFSEHSQVSWRWHGPWNQEAWVPVSPGRPGIPASGTTLHPPQSCPSSQCLEQSLAPDSSKSASHFLGALCPTAALGKGGAPQLYSEEMQGGAQTSEQWTLTGRATFLGHWVRCQREPGFRTQWVTGSSRSPSSGGCEHHTPSLPEPRQGKEGESRPRLFYK